MRSTLRYEEFISFIWLVVQFLITVGFGGLICIAFSFLKIRDYISVNYVPSNLPLLTNHCYMISRILARARYVAQYLPFNEVLRALIIQR